jgi:hypothetical protein
MGKVRSTITGGVNHEQVYKHTHRRDGCAGTIRDGESVHPQVNSLALNDFVESASLRTTKVYDWKKGTVEDRKLDVVKNGHENMNYLKVRPVTNARVQKTEQADRDGYANAPCPTVVGGRWSRG